MIGAGAFFRAHIKLIAIALIVSVLIGSAFVALDRWEKKNGMSKFAHTVFNIICKSHLNNQHFVLDKQ